MKLLRTVLVIVGIICLSAGVLGVLPLSEIRALAIPFGLAGMLNNPLTQYLLRCYCMLSGVLGIFFFILAVNPVKYKPMLILGVLGLVLLGFNCLITGPLIGIPPMGYLGDGLFGTLSGVALLLLYPK